MAPPTKSSKVATRGAKQIVEENISTLSFYRNMVFGASAIYLTTMLVFFAFSTLTVTLTILTGIIYVASHQFMVYMASPKYSESGQLIDSGVDLNMEGGIADLVHWVFVAGTYLRGILILLFKLRHGESTVYGELPSSVLSTGIRGFAVSTSVSASFLLLFLAIVKPSPAIAVTANFSLLSLLLYLQFSNRYVHVKDLIILTSGVQVLSLISNYFWFLWLLAPLRGAWMLWTKILSPWFFAAPQEQPEVDEKKQRKMERKMAKRH